MQNQNMFNSTVLQYREIKCTLVTRIFKPNKTGVVHNAAYIYYIFIVVDQHNGLKFHRKVHHSSFTDLYLHLLCSL